MEPETGWSPFPKGHRSGMIQVYHCHLPLPAREGGGGVEEDREGGSVKGGEMDGGRGYGGGKGGDEDNGMAGGGDEYLGL